MQTHDEPGLTESPGGGTGVGDGRLAWHTLTANRVLHEDG